MKDIIISYSISKKLRFLAVLAGSFLFTLSAGVSVWQALGKQFSFLFFVGIAGLILASLLILSVTVWQAKPVIVINNQHFRICLPKQKIDGEIDWDDVTQIGIGLMSCPEIGLHKISGV